MSAGYVYGQAGDDEEAKRLGYVQAWAGPVTAAQLDAVGDMAGWRCADVGAGAGSVARDLAARVGPSGSVVATDIDCRFLVEMPENVEVRQHDISRDDLDAAAYDLVHCRLVLIHLTEPEVAMARMLAALKPGGWLVIEDADWGLCTIAGTADGAWATAFLHEVSRRHAEVELRFPYFGRHLPGLFARSGVVEIEGTAHLPVCVDGDDAMQLHRLTVRELREASVARGASEEGFDRMLAALDDRAAIVTGVALVGVRGRKPA
jgi:SAM-dependent methyltransferase